jgi:hypothetical protein
MSHRKTLIGVSIAGHAALFAGVFIHGVWDLEQLEYEFRSRSALAVMTPPTPQGGSYTPQEPQVKPKAPPKVVVKEPRQPRKIKEEFRIVTERGSSEPGTGVGKGQGQGPGDGPVIGDPCKEPGGLCAAVSALPTLPEVPVAPPVTVHDVTPQILKGLRISGQTAIYPPRDVHDEMYRAGKLETSASMKVCLTTEGTVSSVTLTASSGYAAYDAAFAAAAWRWIYKPYTVNGTPVPACGMVTFQYAMK